MKIFRYIKNNKILNNFVILFTGDGISSILNIISTAIIIRAIGLDKNGIIIMIQTYALFFDQIFNFKIFESLIKYLIKSIQQDNIEKCKSYIKQGVILDIITASIATILGILCVNIVINIMKWNIYLKSYIVIYMFTVLFNISGVCIGIIRTYNKFNYISYINVVINIIKVLLYIFGLFFNYNFIYYFFVEVLINILKNLVLAISAYKILVKNGMGDFYKVPLKIDKKFFMFSLNTNLASTIDLPINTLSTFIMNKYLGFEAISVFKVFEKIGTLVGKFSGPLNQIIYPELNLYVANGQDDEAIKLSKKLGYGILAIGIFVLFGIVLTNKFWLGIFIPNYHSYLISLYLYILLIIFTNATSTIHSLFMALGYIKYIVPILLCVNLFYIIIIIPVVKSLQLNGVILMLLIQAALVVIIKLLVMKKVKIS